ncbi:hypothetical protein LTR16_008221, partial [Cryomyces antarcticus]
MVDEEIQKTIHIIMNSKWTRKQMPQADAEWQAQWACEAIDKKFEYITDLFRRKYNSSSRSMNPLADHDHTEVAQCLGGAATDFVRRVHALVVEKANDAEYRSQQTPKNRILRDWSHASYRLSGVHDLVTLQLYFMTAQTFYSMHM